MSTAQNGAGAHTVLFADGAAFGEPRFADGKSPEAFRTIGEVAQALAIRPHVLRYWEEQFPMLRPVKRSGGRRYYRPEDVDLVQRIDRLVHREGYTLRGARQFLEGEGATRRPGRLARDCAPATPALAEAPVVSGDASDLLARLQGIRNALALALNES